MSSVKLSASLEDYLEAIYQLEEEKRVARVKEIADKLSVQMPSVTGALKSLKKKGLIEHEKNSYVQLTPLGKKTGETLLEKHNILVDFLANVLLLEQDEAETCGCDIEHILTLEATSRLRNLTNFLATVVEEKGIDGETWKKLVLEKE